MGNLRPLIAICGTTGVGKSKLAIELALYLSQRVASDGWRGARIVNADALQVYRGLDVITNKVPEAERQGVEHVLMGYRSHREQYIVGQWIEDALNVIEETHRKKQIPIVVGGTSYWIQHLLFSNRLVSKVGGSMTQTESPRNQAAETCLSEELESLVASLPPNLHSLFDHLPEHPPSAASEPDAAYDLHILLSILDPLVAARWHWRDTRKVLRSLRIVKETGRRPSDIFSEQMEAGNSSKARYRALCFWLYAETAVLSKRLDDRVDDMIEQGLLDEVRSLWQEVDARQASSPSSESQPVDFTFGIYQSIGFKEFYHYLSSPERTIQDFENARERMKISTRQYAKRQVSWIKNKLLPVIHAANEEHPSTSLYVLDATRDSWLTDVQNPAISIAENFIANETLPDPLSLSEVARQMLGCVKTANNPIAVLNARRKLVCDVCTDEPNRPFMVEEGHEWDVHVNSKAHRGRRTKAERRTKIIHGSETSS